MIMGLFDLYVWNIDDTYVTIFNNRSEKLETHFVSKRRAEQMLANSYIWAYICMIKAFIPMSFYEIK
jgi:hypothetical protein